jgi:ribonuclease HII
MVKQRRHALGDKQLLLLLHYHVMLQVTRDRLMLQLDAQYPQYGFAQHKGYGVSD